MKKIKYPYELSCFVNGTQKPSHEMSKKEAKYFYEAAMQLSEYLMTSYGLEKEHMSKCIVSLNKTASILNHD